MKQTETKTVRKEQEGRFHGEHSVNLFFLLFHFAEHHLTAFWFH